MITKEELNKWKEDYLDLLLNVIGLDRREAEDELAETEAHHYILMDFTPMQALMVEFDSDEFQIEIDDEEEELCME